MTDIFGAFGLDEKEQTTLVEQAEKLAELAPVVEPTKPKPDKPGFTLQELSRQYTEEAIDVIVGIMRGTSITENDEGQIIISKVDNSTRLEAAKMLLDRGWGKPTVKAQIETKHTDVHKVLELMASKVKAPPSLAEDHGLIEAEVAKPDGS